MNTPLNIPLPDTRIDQIAFSEADRIGLTALTPEAIVLCATHRLARDLRQGHDALQIAAGLSRWQPLRALTLVQWLETCLNEALLLGEIDITAAPGLALNAQQERILWDRAIENVENMEADDSAAQAALFDRAGMADAAAEANALMVAWDIRIPPDTQAQSEETRQFLRWRAEFQRLCTAAGALESARYFSWQLDCLAGGAGRLPPQLVIAGYDRYNPQELRLVDILRQRRVAVYELEQGLSEALLCQPPMAYELPDRIAECRAAAAWARQSLLGQPGMRLGIVVPELGALRETLAALLDDALDPAALNPACAEMPRHYNFTLGLPLARQPVVGVALQLLGLLAQSRHIAQEDFATLLRQPYWSADVTEADARAQLDARMRELLAPNLNLEQILRFIAKQNSRGSANAPGKAQPLQRLQAQLEACQTFLAAQSARQTPSGWAQAFVQLLELVGWPGERSLSSHEYQAHRAFSAALDSLCELDAVLGRASLGEAYRHLLQLCRERIFQPQTEGDPPVQVMGLLEAAGTPLDALWVMGMNDHLWPPAARPNPLLPADLQRQARSPNASADVQGAFAAKIQQRLLRSAPQVLFSYANSEAGRELRPSPLLAPILAAGLDFAPLMELPPSVLDTLAGTASLEHIDDHRAPPVEEGELLRGGTALLRAQAICPAWAFYRYRLGARALETPVEGLDSAERGTLLHAVLQAFWQDGEVHGWQDLKDLTPTTRRTAVLRAIEHALTEFNLKREVALSPRFLGLEGERLLKLVEGWLDLEAERPLAFQVVACEEEIEIQIEGISAKLVVDRIDALADGRRVILDYKTGAAISQSSWGKQRITEPQLPIYAALALANAANAGNVEDRQEASATSRIAGVAFAKVRLDDHSFIGIGAEPGLLPKVAGISDAAARKLFPEQHSWDDLLAHWRTSIAAIAREIKAGEAAVSFLDEKDLAYCDVLPLLRLAERKELAT